MTYSSPSRIAVVLHAAKSEPASGSVTPYEAKAPSSVIFLSHFCFCSSVAPVIIGAQANDVAYAAVANPGSPQASSSFTNTSSNVPNPAPPYFSGMCRLSNPISCAACIASFGYCESASQCSALGRLSSTANSCASSRNISCISSSWKLTITLPRGTPL